MTNVRVTIFFINANMGFDWKPHFYQSLQKSFLLCINHNSYKKCSVSHVLNVLGFI